MKQLLTIFLLTITAITSLTLTTPQVEATTTEYNLTFINGSYYSNTGSISVTSYFARTDKISIINNSIILNNQLSKFTLIHFWNNNTYLGHYATNNANSTYMETNLIASLNNNISNFIIPNNSTHFALSSANSSQDAVTNNGISFSNFQTVTVSYNNPATLPTTETSINAINFINNESINLDDGTIISNDSDGMRTDLINISNAPANWQWENPHQSYSAPENGRYYATVFYDSNKDYIGTALHLANDIIENSSNLFPNNAYQSLLSQADYMIIVGANSLSADFLDPYANVYGQTSTFAQFSDNTIDTSMYQITFSNTLGTTQFSDSIYVTAGDPLTNLVNQFSTGVYLDYLAREGYEFTGWNAPATMPSNNVTVTPIWNQLTSYTVTFEDYDGTPLGTDTVFEGQPASPPVIPTRTGYTFTGWQPPIADIQGNITTVAQYTANTYLVTWNSDNVEVQATQLSHGSTILSNAPFVTYEGYAFQGWAIDPGTTLVTSGQIINGPLSLTAIWQATPTFTVTWRDVSFNTLKIEYVQESGLATAPSYDPGSGFVLTGWSPDPTQPITENTIFIANVDTAPPPPSIPGDYNPISDLFGGVIGASVGAIMTLGTIDLYGIQLSAIIYLFVSMSLGLWILKAVRG